MDETSFQEKMNQILERIRELPASGSEESTAQAGAAGNAAERRERLQSSVHELQDALDYLRLSVKYLVFDLEATRRENAYLRRMIEQSNRERERERNQRSDERHEERPEERRDELGGGWE